MSTRRASIAVTAMLVALSAAAARADMSSAFTYQGYLENAGTPVTGTYTCVFRVFDSATGGAALGVDSEDVTFQEGHFTVLLDFDPAVFTGDPRWLGIEVDGTPLTPRQEVTPAPYALRANELTVPAVITGSDDAGLFRITNNGTGGALDGKCEGGKAVRGTHESTGNYGWLGSVSWGAGAVHGPTGNAAHLAGADAAVYGSATDPASWAGWFSGPGYFSDKVGIGTETPGEKLDVNGKVRCEQLQVTDSPTEGHVLTADAGGNASWQPGGFTLPYSDSCDSSPAMSITSTVGTGIRGYGSAPASGAAAGVYGEATGANLALSCGVRGTASSTAPLVNSVYGVYGEVPADTSGEAHGVHGTVRQAGGVGVYGECTAGGGVAVYGDGTDDGVGGFFTGQDNDGSVAAVEIEEFVPGWGMRTMLIDADEIDVRNFDGLGEKLNLNTNTGTPVVMPQLEVPGQSGTTAVVVEGTEGSGNGQIELYNSLGNRTVQIDGDAASDQAGYIAVYDASGTATIEFDADGPGGFGRVTTEVLEITGGADLAEPFDVSALEAGAAVEPGMVVVIDATRSGALRVASTAYDPKVAGIISGANGLSPGMVMKSDGNPHAGGDYPVALTGRVWCWCDASIRPIEPGDRLTTSTTPGHAMKATDAARAPGAVIGKAMTPLAEGRGLVLVLVQPQ